MVDPSPRELGDVQQAVYPPHVDECTEIHDVVDNTLFDAVDLQLFKDGAFVRATAMGTSFGEDQPVAVGGDLNNTESETFAHQSFPTSFRVLGVLKGAPGG